MIAISVRVLVGIIGALYQGIACRLEDRNPPPGKLFDVGGRHLHLFVKGSGSPTVVIDHSLGGVEGYLLMDALSEITRVCVYDRAGYGWSSQSARPRTSRQIVTELDTLLQQAGIAPPYLLVGNSFGSYSVRLYAHKFPQKVMGIVLTDGLHESEMLNLPPQLKALKLLFISGFMMSAVGSAVGMVRLLRTLGVFELLKPELKKFSPSSLRAVKRSFCRPKHWITMGREMMSLEASARQLKGLPLLDLPMVSIRANSFFKPTFWTHFIPLKSANRVREKMHHQLRQLSSNCIEIEAGQSGHFVWTDEPEKIVAAVKLLLNRD